MFMAPPRAYHLLLQQLPSEHAALLTHRVAGGRGEPNHPHERPPEVGGLCYAAPLWR